MRHGPAEDHADSGMDSDRALTASGRDRVRSVAKLLLELDEAAASGRHQSARPRRANRRDRRPGDEARRSRGQRPGASRALARGEGGAALVAALASASSKRVMLVGHEPDLSELTASLLSRSPRGRRSPSTRPWSSGSTSGPRAATHASASCSTRGRSSSTPTIAAAGCNAPDEPGSRPGTQARGQDGPDGLLRTLILGPRRQPDGGAAPRP